MATTDTFEKYGVPVTLSVKDAVSSKSRDRIGFAYPIVQTLSDTITGGFTSNSVNQGNYINASKGKELVRNNLRQLLLTQKGERVMLPEYGLEMSRFLFEPLDQTIFYLIRKEVVLNIRRFFSIARILNIKVFSDNLSTDQSQLRISLTLQLIDESLDIFDIEVSVR